MKKTILSLAVVFGVFALGGISEDMNFQIGYALFWFGEILLSSWLLKKELSK